MESPLQQQQAGYRTTGATANVFQPPLNPAIGEVSFFFAGGVPAPPSGIYLLTPAPPGGLSSLGPRWTGFN